MFPIRSRPFFRWIKVGAVRCPRPFFTTRTAQLSSSILDACRLLSYEPRSIKSSRRSNGIQSEQVALAFQLRRRRSPVISLGLLLPQGHEKKRNHITLKVLANFELLIRELLQSLVSTLKIDPMVEATGAV